MRQPATVRPLPAPGAQVQRLGGGEGPTVRSDQIELSLLSPRASACGMGIVHTLHSGYRSDQIGLSLPSPPRLGVWYGYCAHASDAPLTAMILMKNTTDPRLKRCSLNCLSSRKVSNGKPHGWDSTAERLIRDNLTSQVGQETPRYAFESSRAHGSIVGEKHTAVYQ